MKREPWMSDEGYETGRRAEQLRAALSEPYLLQFTREHPLLIHLLLIALAGFLATSLHECSGGVG